MQQHCDNASHSRLQSPTVIIKFLIIIVELLTLQKFSFNGPMINTARKNYK